MQRYASLELHHASPAFCARPLPTCCSKENVVAIDLITEHIRMKLQQHDLRRIYHNLEVRAERGVRVGWASLCVCPPLPGCNLCTQLPLALLSRALKHTLMLQTRALCKHAHTHVAPHHTTLQVIPSNFQIRGMQTIIRDRNTSAADFIFYSDRLLRLVIEASLGHLPCV